MDREIVEHLARDTGLRPEEIVDDIEPVGADETAQHIAADTGVDEALLTTASEDPVDQMISRLPID